MSTPYITAKINASLAGGLTLYQNQEVKIDLSKLVTAFRLSDPLTYPFKSSTTFTGGILSGKTITDVVAGGNHCFVLCADGTLAAWGNNQWHQVSGDTLAPAMVLEPYLTDITGSDFTGLTVVGADAGNLASLLLCDNGSVFQFGYIPYNAYNAGNPYYSSASNIVAPYLVSAHGSLIGKTVSKVAAGGSHMLALDSDGVVHGWGGNTYNQATHHLGTTYNTIYPMAVAGALGGLTLTQIAAGGSHSLALTGTGSIYAWGLNTSGQLGNGSTATPTTPVAVTMSGALAGKTVTDIKAGGAFSLALCSDGTVYAWGENNRGQLGNASVVDSHVPVAVSVAGVLAGKTVIGIDAGQSHAVALCSDGTLVTWGDNMQGQLGILSTIALSSSPVLATMTTALAGKTVTEVAAGNYHNVVRCSDGTACAWGRALDGQIGNGSAAYSVQTTATTVLQTEHTLYVDHLNFSSANLPPGLRFDGDFVNTAKIIGAPTTVADTTPLIKIQLSDFTAYNPVPSSGNTYAQEGVAFASVPIKVVAVPTTLTPEINSHIMLSDHTFWQNTTASVPLVAVDVMSDTAWEVTGLPPGMYVSGSGGYGGSLTGPPTVPGTYEVVVHLRAQPSTGGDHFDEYLTVTFIVLPAAGTGGSGTSFIDDGDVDLFFDLQTRELSLTLPRSEVKLAAGEMVANVPEVEALPVKVGETLGINLRFVKGTRVIDPVATGIRFGVACQVGGPLVMEGAAFTKVGSGSSTYHKIRVPVSDAEFSSIAGDYFDEDKVETPDAPTAATSEAAQIKGLCEIELTTGSGETIAKIKSDTMPVILSRSILA